MGTVSSYVSSLFQAREPKYKAIMVGSYGVGKTSIIYALEKQTYENTLYGFGQIFENLQYNDFQITSWDIGNSKYELLCRHAYENTNAIIFVVDLTCKENFKEFRTQLEFYLNHEMLKKLPVLVLANKLDIARMDISEVVELFNIQEIKDRQCKCFGVSAVNKEGFVEAFKWLHEVVSEKDEWKVVY